MKVYVVMEFEVNVKDQGGADELVKLTAEDLVKCARDQGETFNTDISEASEEQTGSRWLPMVGMASDVKEDDDEVDEKNIDDEVDDD